MNPFVKFENWYTQEQKATNVKIPSACCLSTIGLDGYPNARMVSLKELKEEQFIITGSFDSRKGKEMLNNPKVALTFWWAITEKQVRIQGTAKPITESEAEQYFQNRSQASKVVSSISKQGEVIETYPKFKAQYIKASENMKDKTIHRPNNWGGFSISPKRIEFLEFDPNRFHARTLYSLENGQWNVHLLQP